MEALDPKQNEIYNFLRCEQEERIGMKKAMEDLKIQKGAQNSKTCYRMVI